VLGITIVRAFVGRTNPSLADLLDHFEHAASVAGVEHVGLGSDVDATALDPATSRPDPIYRVRGLEPEARVFQIADGLLRRGWIADDVRLVLGGNFRRALRAIWPRAPDRDSARWSLGRDPFCPVPPRSLPPFLRVV
jgi:membrane dipeptidase